MKKTLLIVTLVVLALGVLGVGAAYAQGGQPPRWGTTGYGYGPLHSYVVEAFAAKLGLTADEVNSRLARGETMYQIALAEGIAADKIAALLTEVHTQALDAAVKDGVLTRQQADWMLPRMQAMWQNGYGYGPGNCPMNNGLYGPNGAGSGFRRGPGMMGGWGW